MHTFQGAPTPASAAIPLPGPGPALQVAAWSRVRSPLSCTLPQLSQPPLLGLPAAPDPALKRSMTHGEGRGAPRFSRGRRAFGHTRARGTVPAGRRPGGERGARGAGGQGERGPGMSVRVTHAGFH